MLAATIGQDPLTGDVRLTFGSEELIAGVNFISVIIGLFAIGQVLVNVEKAITYIYEQQEAREWMPKWLDIKQCWGAMIRLDSFIRFFLGLLPAALHR